jgi:hypothetical protein
MWLHPLIELALLKANFVDASRSLEDVLLACGLEVACDRQLQHRLVLIQ